MTSRDSLRAERVKYWSGDEDWNCIASSVSVPAAFLCWPLLLLLLFETGSHATQTDLKAHCIAL